MARYQVVKGKIGWTNGNLWLFASKLVSCVHEACREIAYEISSQPDAAFGTTKKIAQGAVNAGGAAAANFANSIVAPHADAYARHFMSVDGKTVRMDLGNTVEQAVANKLAAS